MTSSGPDDAERARRRRAAELLGELVPGSSDDTDHGWGETSRSSSRDDEMLRDVPPHHG